MNDASYVVIHPLDRYFRTGRFVDGLIAMYVMAKVQGGIGVEVGSGRGESAEIACQFLKHLYCVDSWTPGFDFNEPFFDQRMSTYRNYTKIKKASCDACGQFQDESLDIVYIDGMHDYENVKMDLLCWFPKIKPSGWIGGHDYDNDVGHDGVIQAVDEVLGPPALRFVDSSFLFQKTPELVTRVAQLCAQ